jgi:microcystin-dependent protein
MTDYTLVTINSRPLASSVPLAGNLLVTDSGTTKRMVTQTLITEAVAQANATTRAIANGGTGATSAAAARTNLSAAQSGNNNDITALSALASVPAVVTTAIAALIPSGSMIQYAGAAAPTGWLICDGSAINRTTFAALFSAIGTTYGVGNGTTTFNLPDLRGRSVVGVGTGSGLTARTLAATGGAETHVLSTGEMPAHGHRVNISGIAGSATTHLSVLSAGGATSYFTSNGGANLVENTGSGAAHNTMHPFIALNCIIKT